MWSVEGMSVLYHLRSLGFLRNEMIHMRRKNPAAPAKRSVGEIPVGNIGSRLERSFFLTVSVNLFRIVGFPAFSRVGESFVKHGIHGFIRDEAEFMQESEGKSHDCTEKISFSRHV